MKWVYTKGDDFCGYQGGRSAMIPVRVFAVGEDPLSRQILVILKDDVTRKWLPIAIGPFEAQSIKIKLEDNVTPRPITHDLYVNTLKSFGAEINKIVITDLKNNTFYATLSIKIGERITEIDSRPSDAIAVALRTHAPIFVSETVMNEAGILEKDDDKSTKEPITKVAQLRKLLDEALLREEYEEAAKIRDKIRVEVDNAGGGEKPSPEAPNN